MIDDIGLLSEQISELNTLLNDKMSKLEYINNEIKEKNNQIEILKQKLSDYDKIIILFQKVGEFARSEIKKQIEDIISKCLSMIFREDISFIINIVEKRDNYAAEIYIENTYGDIKLTVDPKESKGGGIIDVISLASRIAFLELYNPKLEGPLILDEPGKHLSNEYTPYLSEFLENISLTFNRQIIMVTHNDYMSAHANKLFNVSQLNGITTVNNIDY